MIKIYLNPAQDTIWEEVPVNQTEHLESVAAAQKLLYAPRVQWDLGSTTGATAAP